MRPRVGLDGAENLAHTGIRSPDRPARSESLYRLSYPTAQCSSPTGPKMCCMYLQSSCQKYSPLRLTNVSLFTINMISEKYV
jgi:hypothetical protein